MRISRKEYRQSLDPQGREIYDFLIKYGIPADHFSRRLDISQASFQYKLKGSRDFTVSELQFILDEIARIKKKIKPIDSVIIDIYGKTI